jgi:hypothetical protein
MSQNEIVKKIQHENTGIPEPDIDYNYILLNRSLKYLLNFSIIYLSVSFTVYNNPNLTAGQFILLICMISTISFYLLDLSFPSCSI